MQKSGTRLDFWTRLCLYRSVYMLICEQDLAFECVLSTLTWQNARMTFGELHFNKPFLPLMRPSGAGSRSCIG